MAQTGYTPILIYSSSTASNLPSASNLTNSTLGSELAINIADGKLFYKDTSNAVQVIAWKVTPTSAGGTGLTSYTAGDMLYYASGTALSKLAIGSSGAYMSSSGTAPQWTAPAALTKTDDTNVTLTLGGSASTALLNAASLTLGWTGTLSVSRGGTGTGTAFTAGSVVFAGASGVYSQDNSNFYWDDTNNFLGIGTATPVGILELQSATPKQTISNNSNTSTTTGTVYSTLAMRSLKGGGAGSFAYDDAWIQTQRSNYNYNGDFFTHDSKLVFFTNDSNRDNDPTARMSLNAQGLTIINSGNLIQGTAATGVNFTANTPAAGMTSQLLNWYEEGTWTPVYTPASGAFGTIGAVNTGRYRRIGRTVFFWADIRTTGTPSLGTASGQLYITGLPFTASADGGFGQVSIMQKWNLGTALTNVGVVVEASNTRLYFTKNSSNSGVTYIQATELSTATDNFGNLMGIFGMYTV